MAFGDTIAETVLGKPTAPEDTNNAPNVIAEGAAVNTTVGITAHSTFANGNASLDYSLSADSSGGGFKIDQNTGVVTVADPSKIDFESAPGHVYTITVVATKNNNFSSSQTFTISVNDVAPSAPVDSNAAANTVLEGAANGTAVGVTASSTDVSGGAVTYSLIGDTSGGGFTVNATTGVVTVADGSKIDFESSAGHAYTVTVQSSDGTLTSSQAFTINVGDVALATPTDTNGATNSVAEGAAAGTTVGITASAVDPSGPATTYSLIGDTSAGGFAINATTGVVTVANPAKLDFESTAPGHTYNITVQASNGVTTTSQVFTVGVTDVAPSAPTDSNGAANTVVEGAANGTVVGVTAASTDVNGGAVTYSLTGDTSGGGFTINATTGVITVADSTKINYETAPGHAYTVTAQASDGTLNNSQTFTIAVSDVAPLAPVDSNGATNTVAEGAASGSTVGVTAFSTDVNGPGVTYSLTGDTSGGGFTVNSTTGVVTVADSTKLDYETGPAGHNYTVTVQASDGTLSNSSSFTIALTDVAPTAPVDTNGGTNTVAEGAANGSTVGITASSVDPNGPATTYSLTDNAGGRFAINSTTGVVTVANGAAIDFETAPGHAYGITVQATNGALTQSSAFSIGVTDVGPSTPADINGTGDSVFEGAANGTLVGITASSTDPGGGPAPTYTLTDSAGGRFTINSTTGVVSIANGAAIDFETAPGAGHSYGITVQSTAGALSTTQNFSIAVGNVNEAPAGTDKAVLIAEDTTYTFGVADFGFSDPSDSVSPNSLQAVKMTTVPGAGTGTLKNNGVTLIAGDSVSAADIAAGHLVFTPVLDGNGSPLATFTFQVQDNGGILNGGVDLDQSANTFTINVNAGNDAPINTVPGAAQTVNEEGSFVFSTGTGNAITIGDVDVGSGNETVTLTVTGGTLTLGSTAGLASVTNNGTSSVTLSGTVANVNNALNGLTYTGNLNFNGVDTLTVNTNDNGNTGLPGPRDDTDTVTINVNEIADTPSVTNATTNEDTQSASGLVVSRNAADGTGVGFFKITGITNGTLFQNDGTTAIANGDFITFAQANAGLKFTPAANFFGNGTFDVQASTTNTNAGLGGSVQTATVTVNAVADTPSVTNATTNEDTQSASGLVVSRAGVDGAEVGFFKITGIANGTLFQNDGTTAIANGDFITFAQANAGLKFTPTANFFGNGTFDVQASTTNTNAGLGGSVQTATVTVNAVADTPSVTNATTNEDTQSASGLVVSRAGVDGAEVGFFKITGIANGTLFQNDGTTAIANGDFITFAQANAGLKFTPAANFFGNGTFDVQASTTNTNAGLGGSVQTATVAVNAVADTPSVTNATTNEDTQSASGLVVSRAGVDGAEVGFFKITGIANGTLFQNDGTTAIANGDFITFAQANAGLKFTPAANFFGNGTFDVQASTTNTNAGLGGSVQTATVAVNAVADTPSVTNATTNEDTQSASGLVVSRAGVDGAEVGFFKITGIANGTLFQNDGTTAIANGDFITFAQANAGLKFTPAANFFGNGTFNVQASTTNADAGLGGSVQTATITVGPVNDAPTLTSHDRDPTYAPGVQLFDTTAVTVGPANESTQNVKQLVLTVSNVDGTGSNDHMSIDGTDVFLTDTNTAVGANHGVNISVALAGGVATVTIFKTAGDISAADVASIVNGLTYTNEAVDPGELARHVTLTSIQDSGGTAPGVDTTSLTIDSTVNFNVAPTIVAGGTLNYTENDGPTVIDATIDITDTDSPNMTGAKVTISGGFDSTQDVLNFTPSGGISGSYNASTGVLTLTGTASQAAYETVLGTVTYQNTSDNPTTTARTVSYTVNDGIVDSAAGTATVNVTAVNDAPATTAGGTLSYTENQAATVIDAGVTVSDVDNANMNSATVAITGGFATGQDVLDANISGTTITKSYNAATGVLTLNGSDTKAHYQQVLDSVTYFNSSENPSGAARTVSYTVNDGAANSNTSTATINVTPVNDAPVTTAGGTLSYTENQAATVIDAGVTATDLDNANLASATVAITGGFATGQDVLDANITGTTITKSYNAATGVLTLNGSDTKAHYQQVLDSVTYFNSSDNPSGADRTVSYTVNDGALASNTSTATVHVTPVNDAPVVTATGTLTYTENQGAAAIAPALTVTDADTGTLTTATVDIGAGYVNGEDVLAFSNTANITGTFDPLTGTMTLTGTDTVANYQAALRSVTYTDTSENPSTAARTVTFNADDGQGVNHLSAGSNHTITVASVDDAPINNNVPANFIAQSGFAHIITGLSIADVDAGANDVTTTFTAAAGTVSIGNGTSGGTAGISGGATITTNASGTVVLTGTVAEINTSLSGNNVAYTAVDNVTTPTTTTLSMATNDLGHTGTGGPITDTDVITVGVIPQVWFIDSTPTSVDTNAPLGSQANPFASVHDFNVSSGPGNNDYIYVKEGTYDGEGINLKPGQTLLGDDQALSFTNPLPGGGTIVIEDASGTRPIISVNAANATDQGIALASNNTVAGINVVTNAAGQTGIDDSGATVGTLNISAADVTGSGQAINITHGSTGGSMAFGTVSSSGGTNGIALGGTLATSFSATTGTLSGHSGSEVAITGGSAAVSYGGTIGDGSGASASITGRTAGAVTLSGNINDGADVGGGISISSNTGGTIDFTGATKTLNTVTSNAVSMTSNSGATVNFSGGGLDIDTTSGIGFSASVAGTYSVTGSSNTINTTSGTALNLAFVTAGAGGINFASASTTSAPSAIVIDTVGGGAINVSGGSIAGATTRGVDINATSSDISIASSITTTAAGRSVEVTGTTGNKTIAFSGAIDDNGLGVNLATNTGTTMNFTGGLQIDTGANTGFNATGGGTVNVTGASNHIATTTGTALNVNGTNIGSSNLIFHDISSNGGSNNGINLVNTGTAAGNGGLHVTGNGTTVGASGGGVIANKTGADGSTTQGTGIYLDTTKDVQLNGMQLNGFQNYAIKATDVNGFSLQNSVVNGANGTSSALDESSVFFLNSSGIIALNNVDVSGGLDNNLYVLYDSATPDTATYNVTGGSKFHDLQSNLGNAQVNLESRTTASASSNVTFNFTGATFENDANTSPAAATHNWSDGILVTFEGGFQHALNVRDSTFHHLFQALDMASGFNADVNYIIRNNNITFTESNTIAFGTSTTSTAAAFVTALIQDNTIGNSGTALADHNSGSELGSGIVADFRGLETAQVTIHNNTIQHTEVNPLRVFGSNNNGLLEVQITNNTVKVADDDGGGGFGVGPGIEVLAQTPHDINLDIRNNNSVGFGGGFGISLLQQTSSTFNLEGFNGVGGTNAATVAAFLASNNAGTTTQVRTGGVGTIVNYTGGNATTPTPEAPMLAALGGIASSSNTPGETHLTQAQLDSVVAAAIAQWTHAGATATQLAALAAINFSVADLSGNDIGEHTSGHIVIDTDAAGHGWFVDPTPNENSEFTHAQNAAGTDLYTDPANAAAGHLDLLTAVTHEMGHELGLDDLTASSDAHELMYINLVDGERRLPDASDVAQATASDAMQIEYALPVLARAAAGTPIIVGTAGNDSIDAGYGGNILFGGGGADNFVFGPSIQLNAPTPAQITHVADYSAAQGDTFDFSAITSAFHNSGVSDALVVRAVEDASGKFAMLQVDHIDPMGLPSAPNWVNVAQLDGAHAGDSVNVLIDNNHSVHLAQIHVDLLV